MTIQAKPIFTEAGINHAINTNANGVAFQITHISFGDAKFDPTGTETSLPNERLRVPISSSTRINDNTFKVSAKVKSPTTDSFFCQSIGFWSNETLFALYSSNANSSDGLFAIHHNVEVLASYVLGLDRLAADEFTIVVGGDQDKLSQMLSVSENNFYDQLQKQKEDFDSKLTIKDNQLNILENKINQKLPITGGKLTGDLDMGGNFIKFGVGDGGEATIGRNKSGEGFAVWEGDYKDYWTNGTEPMLEVKDGSNETPAGVFNYGTRLANVKDTQKIIDDLSVNFTYSPKGNQRVDLRHLSPDKYYLIIANQALDAKAPLGGTPQFVNIISDSEVDSPASTHSSHKVHCNVLFKTVGLYWGNWWTPDQNAMVEWNYYGLTDKSPIIGVGSDYKLSVPYFYARGGWAFEVRTALPVNWEICTNAKYLNSTGSSWEIDSPINYDEKLVPESPQQQLTEKVLKEPTILSESNEDGGHVAEGYTFLPNGLVMQWTWFRTTYAVNWPIAFKKIYTVTNSSDIHAKVSYNNTKVWQDVSTFTRVFAIGEI